MNIIKKTALIFLTAIFLSANCSAAFAEVAAKSSAESLSETIAHIDKAIVDVNESNFASANLHLKAARTSSEQITGNAEILKEANGNIIQGQIQSKEGNINKSIALLNKGLALYKSL